MNTNTQKMNTNTFNYNLVFPPFDSTTSNKSNDISNYFNRTVTVLHADGYTEELTGCEAALYLIKQDMEKIEIEEQKNAQRLQSLFPNNKTIKNEIKMNDLNMKHYKSMIDKNLHLYKTDFEETQELNRSNDINVGDVGDANDEAYQMHLNYIEQVNRFRRAV